MYQNSCYAHTYISAIADLVDTGLETIPSLAIVKTWYTLAVYK